MREMGVRDRLERDTEFTQERYRDRERELERGRKKQRVYVCVGMRGKVHTYTGEIEIEA